MGRRRRLGIRRQLLLLFALLLAAGAGVLALDEYGQRHTRAAETRLKDISLSGVRRVMAVTDAYGRELVDSVFKLRTGQISWPEAQAAVEAALARSELHWVELAGLPMNARQRQVFEQADAARRAALPVLQQLQQALAAQDRARLDQLTDQALYRTLDPITGRLQFLSDLWMIAAEDTVRADVERSRWVRLARIAISLVTLATVALVGWALVRDLYRGFDSLLDLSQAMQKRDFEREPRFRPRGEFGQLLDAFLAMRTDVRKYAHELQVTLESNDEVRRWLQERDIFQRSLLSAAQTAILSIDADGRYTHVNPFAEALLGYQAEQLIGERTPELLHDPAELAAVADELGAPQDSGWRVFQALATRGAPAREWTLTRADGRRVPVLLGVSAMTGDHGDLRGLLFVATDLTEIKRLETDLRASEARAKRANRAKSIFLAAMSHEIRTPMIGVTGMVEVLAHTKLDEEQRRALNVIQHSADNLLQIIGDILDFSKIEAGRLELAPVVCSLRSVVATTVYNFTGSASSKGLQLSFDVDEGVGHAHRADPLRLRQILGNFLSNAIKFTERGSIRVSLRALGGDEASQQLEFLVADTGIGIALEAQARLFQPFTQAEADTTRRFGGTGLGLAICRRLAELMAGEVTMQSAPGVGTTMRLAITLPLADPAEIAAGDGDDGFAARSFSPRRLPERDEAEREGSLILLVDDHPTNRDVISRQLALLGFVCETADDGEQGLERWLAGRYALVLSDVHMPRMDGYELARAIRAIEAREQRPRTPILAITAAAMRGEAQRCFAAGMDDYLVKPVGLELLLEKLRQWLPHLAERHALPPADAAPTAAEPLPQLDRPPPIDPAALAEVCAGDPASEREVLLDFVASTRRDLEQLQRLQAGGDPLETARQAHRIKGAAKLVGAGEIADCAQAVEVAGRRGDLQALHATVPDLLTAFERLRLFLSQRYAVGETG